MSECYIVLGSARSGTSVTAGMLHRMGVVMGWELEPENGQRRFDWPDPFEMNPTGFYQDAPIEEALFRVWGNDYPLPGTRANADQLAEFHQCVKMRVDRQLPKWGIKSSHMPWVLAEFLESCPHDVRLVVTDRDPDQSARSILRWFPDTTIDECNEWVAHVRGQIALVLNDQQFAHLPRHVVSFADLHRYPDATIKKLAKFAGVKDTASARALFDPSLWRIK